MRTTSATTVHVYHVHRHRLEGTIVLLVLDKRLLAVLVHEDIVLQYGGRIGGESAQHSGASVPPETRDPEVGDLGMRGGMGGRFGYSASVHDAHYTADGVARPLRRLGRVS